MNMYLSPFTRSYPASARLLSDDFFRVFFGGNPYTPQNTMKVNILEKDDAYQIEAELPGIDPASIELTYGKDILTIAAGYDNSTEKEEDGRRYSERASGSFRRSFRVKGIREEDITAASKNGVLTVTLPKAEPETGGLRRIPIGE